MFVFVFVLFIFASVADAKNVISYAESGYDGSETDVFAANDAVMLTVDENSWYSEGFPSSDITRRRDGITSSLVYLRSTGDEITKDYTSVSYDLTGDNIYLNDFLALQTGIRIDKVNFSSVSELGAPQMYDADIEVVTVAGSFTSSISIEAGSFSLVTVDLTEASGRLITLKITVHLAGREPNTVRLTSPLLLDEYTLVLSNIHRYLTDTLTVSAGSMTMRSGNIRPDSGNHAAVSGVFLTDEPFRDADVFAAVRVSGMVSGNISLRFTDDEGERFISRQSAGEAISDVYLFPLTIHGTAVSYSLVFDSVKCSVYFTLESVEIIPALPKPFAGNADLGSVTSVSRSGDNITFKGSIKRSAASQYEDGTLHFCALSCLRANDISYSVDLGSVRMTNVFEYTVNLSNQPVSAETFLFFVKLVTDDGEEFAVSSPASVDNDVQTSDKVSLTGLHGGATVGVFESNVSHVMVDVYLNRLLDGGGVSVSYTVYGEESSALLTMSSDILSELDNDISFYQSAGIRVYLRILFDEPVDGLTFDSEAENYIPRLSDSYSCHTYSAIVRYLSKRYPGIRGYVIGRSTNTPDMTGFSSYQACDAPALASYIATLAEITYRASARYISSPEIVLPFTEWKAGDDSMSPRTLISMLGYRGVRTPWTLMWEGEPSGVSSLFVFLSDAGYQRPGLMFITYPSRANASFCSDFWETCSAYSPSAAFVSLENARLRETHSFYSSLKNLSGQTSAETDSRTVTESHALLEGYAGRGFCSIWDFSDSYHSCGWVAGGGVSSCASSDGHFTDSRVLRTVFDASENGYSGMILCNFSKVIDMTDVGALIFDFALRNSGSEGYADNVTIVFVLGSDDTRAEYYIDSVPCGKAITLTCPIENFENRSTVSYVGIMVYSDSAIEFELSSVQAGSRTLDNDDLCSLFFPADIVQSPTPDYLTVIILAAAVAVITINVIILLARADREYDLTQKERGTAHE